MDFSGYDISGLDHQSGYEIEEFHYQRSTGTLRIVSRNGFSATWVDLENVNSEGKVDIYRDVETEEAQLRQELAVAIVRALSPVDSVRASITVTGRGYAKMTAPSTEDQE
jgi:hypothetical protein